MSAPHGLFWTRSRFLGAALLAFVAGWLFAAVSSAATCGNGIVESPETCDDGALIAGDGCSATCALEPNTCIDDVTNVTNNCTANDVQLGLIVEVQQSDGCDFPGDTAQVQLQGALRATSAERYDIGIFIALDGGTARTGVCHHNYLPSSGSATYVPGAPGIGNGPGPFYDAEVSEDAADDCGDLLQGVDNYYDLQDHDFDGTLQTLTIQCLDSDDNGFVDIGSCVSWDNQKTQTCTTVLDTVPNNKSKCRCDTLNTNLPFPGRILIDKVTDPASDPTLFPFTLAGGPDAVDEDFEIASAQAPFGPGDNDGYFKPGTYTVVENVPADWDLTNLTCSVAGEPHPDLDNDGKVDPNEPVDPDVDFTVDLAAKTATIHVDPNETVTCTYTDRKKSRILVDKVTNPTGDVQSFSFDAVGGSYTDFSLTDAAAPNDQVLAAGSYSVSETVPTGWDLTSSLFFNDTADTETIGAIELDVGETVTCTFTNTRRGTIVVDKVTNPAGDPTSFSFDAGGTGYVDFSLTDAAAPNSQSLAPGNYSVSETVPSGWALSSACTSSLGGAENPAAIVLGAGETVSCTFTNTKNGHIVVDKVTDPAGDGQSFDFVAAGGAYTSFSLTDAATPNDQALAPGNYSVSETVPAGWDLTSSPCISSIGDTETIGAIELDAGETVTCTFTNTKRGHIVVDKVTNPAADPTSFSFDAGGTGYDDFSLTDAATPDDQELVPGTYSVSETVPAGWDLTSSTCTSSIDDTETIGAIELDAGETVTCTFTNTKRGRIVVDKVTDPSGHQQSFAFTAGGGTYTSFNLTDAATPNSQELVPGSYTVSESVPAGWDLTGLSCSDPDGGTSTASPQATVDLDAGETVTCTFTNTQRGRIVVDKVTDPSGDAQSFSFTAGGGSYTSFSLTDAATPNDQELVPGSYTVSESVPAGWDLTGLSCSDPDGGTSTASPQATIDLDAGETVTCTFTNTKRGGILIDKVTLPAGDPQAFGFTLTGGPDGIDQAFQLADATSPHSSGSVKPGTYAAGETVATGWDLTGATCSDGSPVNAIVLSAGETVTCTFTNTKRGRILVDKATNPAGDPQLFDFGLAGVSVPSPYSASFQLADGTAPFDSGLVRPGTYGASETVPDGWDFSGASCTDGSPVAAIALGPGETILCTFNNTKRGNVTVLKTTNLVVDPTKSINFTLTGPGLPSGGVTLNVNGDADGVLDTFPTLTPGSTYRMCENPVPAGYTSYWQLDGAIVTPYNPNATDVPPQDLGVRCYDFSVAPGTTASFVIDNSHPGGDPRTIGYWKNWSRCSGGGQVAVAAANGGPDAGVFLLDDLLPQTIGDLVVTTCPVGVDILNKSDIGTHKKMANDAAYELAAQFLATRLNLAAGAETCTAVETAVVSAQTLFAQIDFDGTGEFLGSKVKGAKVAQRNQALSLASTLDRYNNGLLCP